VAMDCRSSASISRSLHLLSDEGSRDTIGYAVSEAYGCPIQNKTMRDVQGF
jgi:hypothetical protein